MVLAWNKFDFGNIQNNLTELTHKLDNIMKIPNIRLNEPSILNTKLKIQKMFDYEEEMLKIKGTENTIL